MDKKIHMHVSPAPQPWLHSIHRPRVNWAFIAVWAPVLLAWVCGVWWWLR